MSASPTRVRGVRVTFVLLSLTASPALPAKPDGKAEPGGPPEDAASAELCEEVPCGAHVVE